MPISARLKQNLLLDKSMTSLLALQSSHATLKVLLLVFIFTFTSTGLTEARNIAFFYAIEEDFRAMVNEHGLSVDAQEAGIRKITFGDNDVYAVKLGSGAVESAISTQEILVRLNIDVAFSVGVVGSLTDRLEVGDLVSVQDVVAWQKVPFANFSRPAANSVKLENWKRSDESILTETMKTLNSVRVASGEIFIKSSEYREMILRATNADVIDMNLFGLLSALRRHDLPSWHLRVVSDHADDSAATDFAEFINQYDGICGRMIGNLISRLPVDKTAPEEYEGLRSLIDNELN